MKAIETFVEVRRHLWTCAKRKSTLFLRAAIPLNIDSLRNSKQTKLTQRGSMDMQVSDITQKRRAKATMWVPVCANPRL